MAVILAVVASAVWGAVVTGGNYCWSAFAFTMVAIPVAGGILLLGVVPSAVLYRRKKQLIERTSVLLAGCSFIVVLVEITLLWIIPLRGE